MAIEFDYLVDIASTKDQEEQEGLKDLIQKEYDFLAPYLDDLYFIEANTVFLNYVCKVPQAVISDLFKIKQYGVSKRISSALRRLAIQLKAPDKEVSDSYKFLKNIINPVSAYTLITWYNLKTISATTKALRASNPAITKNLVEVETKLRALHTSENSLDFKTTLVKDRGVEELPPNFLNNILNNQSFYLITKHKIGTHLQYMKELQEYNSRGSHSFRKVWH